MQTEQKLNHLYKYWRLSIRFFNERDFALASFFAITLMEEVGKIIILGNEALSGELDKKGFRNHREKYNYAVISTLAVNSRVSRIYGDDEHIFAKWFRDDELFRIRNSALYIELAQNGIITPDKAVTKEKATLLVCIAGEVLAEIQGAHLGSEPEKWEELLLEVDEFRKQNSYR